MCLFVATTASAQFTGATEVHTPWKLKTVSFKLSEVASALGTDAATFGAAFNEWQDAETAETNLLFLVSPDDNTLTDGYTCDGKGFFMTKDGAVDNWGAAGTWYTYATADADNDSFTFNVALSDALAEGVTPLAPGDVAKASLVVKYGDKEASFLLTVNVVEKPSHDIPEPTLLWNALTIVDDLVVEGELKLGAYGTVTADISAALGKLGVDPEVAADELDKLLYATRYYLTDDVALGGMKHDSLTNQSTANAPGFWLRAVNDAEGNETNECCATSWGGDDHFYVEQFSFDVESGQLSCIMGQMAGNLKEGEQYYTYIYLVYGDKAVRIRYNLNVVEAHLGTLEDYEKAGEVTIEVEMTAKTNGDYATKAFSVDSEAIAAALGCELSEVDFWACRDDITFTDKNQEGVGYWYNRDGYVTDWGESAMVYVTPQADDLSKFGIGQYPDHLKVGEEVSVPLYFLGNNRYYKVTVHLTVVETKVIEGDFESVAQRSYVVQQVPVEYEWTPGIAIPEDWVAEVLGSTEWEVYGLAALNEDGTEKPGNENYTKAYTCTPYPGFWLSADGRNNGWNSNARIGITAAAPDGGFALMQYQDGVCKAGDSFKTQLFLVNEQTGKMVTFNFTYNIVNEVIEVENVGSEEIVLPVSEDETTATIDLTAAAEALGVSVDDLLAAETLCGMTESGLYSGGQMSEDGLAFNSAGFFDQVNPLVSFTLTQDGDNVVVTSWAEDQITDDFRLSTQFCFQVDNKQYVFSVKFVAPSVYTGVSTVAAAPASQPRVYDLSGRQVQRPTRGLYIVGGKKLLVK